MTLLPMAVVQHASEAAAASLIGAIWQGTLLAGAAFLGLKLLPKTPAGARFAIWFAVFAAVFALPFLSLGQGSATAVVGHGAWLTLGGMWSVGFLAVWMLASLVRAFTLVVGAARVRALWRRAIPVELPEAAALTSSGRKAEICISSEVDRPSVIGFFAPRILIPNWLLDRLTPEEIAHVVLHEAGHLGRADDWLNLVQKIALVLFPLNPALLWIERRLCFERELACDERVLRATGSPKAYASCLAALAEHRMSRRSAALVMAALGRESDLGQRVTRILDNTERMRPTQARVVMGLSVALLMVSATGLEHCPELVGFAQPESSSSLASAAPSTMLDGLGAQGFRVHPVVFRLGAAHASMLVARQPIARQPVSLARPTIANHPARSAAPGSAEIAPTETKTIPASRAPHEVRTSANISARPAARAATPWMVLTTTTATWTSEGGEHVSMTSFVATAAPKSGVAQAVSTRSGVSSPAAFSAESQDTPDLPMYTAAVPVRGGWLLFQL